MNDSGTDLADIGPEPTPVHGLYRRRRNDMRTTTVAGLACRRAGRLDFARDDRTRLTRPVIGPGMDTGMEGRPE